MRYLLVASMLLGSVTSANAQVRVGITFPSIDIGIHVPAYPELVLVPGYPVYYAPHASSNYFFYDGAYWVYQGDSWYVSSWYDGPWQVVSPEYVPAFVLRVPVRYYRRPPVHFHGWHADAPPRWGEHWGRDWERRRGGWDRWDRRAVPRAAPLPVYQRSYSGHRYPRAPERQHSIRAEQYRYRPHDTVTRQHYDHARSPRAEPQRQSHGERRSSARPHDRDDRHDRGDRDDRRGRGDRDDRHDRGDRDDRRGRDDRYDRGDRDDRRGRDDRHDRGDRDDRRGRDDRHDDDRGNKKDERGRDRR